MTVRASNRAPAAVTATGYRPAAGEAALRGRK